MQQTINTFARMLLGCCLLLLSAATSAADALHEFNPDSLPRIISSQKGHPFVLVVWSLDCEFCRASLNLLSQKKRLRKDLRVVTLATDPLADPQAAALIGKTLAKLDLRNDAWAFGAAPPEQLRYAIDQKWHGEMPRSYWFDGTGTGRATSGVVTSAMVDAFLAAR